MEKYLNKNERIIAVIAIPVIAAFFALFLYVNRGGKPVDQFETGISINYEMGRAEQAYSEYSLDGREWDQTYEALEQKARKAKKDKLDKKKADLIAKQTAQAKKQAEIKKYQDAVSRAKKAQQAAQEQIKQKTVQEVQRAAVVQAAASADRVAQQDTNYAGGSFNNSNVTSEQNVAQADNDKKSDDKKSFAEWRAQLFANPTAENLAQFVAAFRKNEVTADEYQAMAQDLISQRDLRYKALGLAALRSAPSLASLSQLVHLDTSTLGSYASYVGESINAYLQSQNLPYLNQALQTQDKVLVVKSLNLLNDNLEKLNSGDTSVIVDPRNRRDGTVAVFSMQDYSILIPNLMRLAGSQDQELARMAQNASSLIQSYNNIARN